LFKKIKLFAKVNCNKFVEGSKNAIFVFEIRVIPVLFQAKYLFGRPLFYIS